VTGQIDHFVTPNEHIFAIERIRYRHVRLLQLFLLFCVLRSLLDCCRKDLERLEKKRLELEQKIRQEEEQKAMTAIINEAAQKVSIELSW